MLTFSTVEIGAEPAAVRGSEVETHLRIHTAWGRPFGGAQDPITEGSVESHVCGVDERRRGPNGNIL